MPAKSSLVLLSRFWLVSGTFCLGSPLPESHQAEASTLLMDRKKPKQVEETQEAIWNFPRAPLIKTVQIWMSSGVSCFEHSMTASEWRPRSHRHKHKKKQQWTNGELVQVASLRLERRPRPWAEDPLRHEATSVHVLAQKGAAGGKFLAIAGA